MSFQWGEGGREGSYTDFAFWGNAHAFRQFWDIVKWPEQTCFNGRGNWSAPEETHINSLPHPGFECEIFLLWGSSANHRATMLPVTHICLNNQNSKKNPWLKGRGATESLSAQPGEIGVAISLETDYFSSWPNSCKWKGTSLPRTCKSVTIALQD